MTNIVVWSAFSTSPEMVTARFPDDRIFAIADETGLAAAADAEVAFSGNNPRRVRKLLDAGIFTSLRTDRKGQKYIRLSPHFYNTDAELARVMEHI